MDDFCSGKELSIFWLDNLRSSLAEEEEDWWALSETCHIKQSTAEWQLYDSHFPVKGSTDYRCQLLPASQLQHAILMHKAILIIFSIIPEITPMFNNRLLLYESIYELLARNLLTYSKLCMDALFTVSSENKCCKWNSHTYILNQRHSDIKIPSPNWSIQNHRQNLSTEYSNFYDFWHQTKRQKVVDWKVASITQIQFNSTFINDLFAVLMSWIFLCSRDEAAIHTWFYLSHLHQPPY
jgi:hypothetical protein